MTFPLCRRPGAVVFLDDDPAYLETLALVLPAPWQVDLFVRPSACINHLQQQPPLWEADTWAQQQVVERGRNGAALIPEILRYWREAIARHSFTQVCVVDYAMPGMNGLETLSELMDWSGARVLLTGQADEQIAVQAFNQALIDQFIPKQIAGASRRIIDTVQHLMNRAHPRHAQIWRSTLSARQAAALAVPSVGTQLADYARRHWVEYIVVGHPFGILGQSASGLVSWLQLESPQGLADLAELAQTQGFGEQAIAAIRAGQQLPSLELRQSLGTPDQLGMQPAFSLGSSENLIGAVFEIGPLHARDQDATAKPTLPSERLVRD